MYTCTCLYMYMYLYNYNYNNFLTLLSQVAHQMEVSNLIMLMVIEQVVSPPLRWDVWDLELYQVPLNILLGI